MNKKNLLIIFLCILVMAIWGSLYAVVKLEFIKFDFNVKENTFDIILFAGLRFLISGLILFIFSLIIFRKQKPLENIFKNKNKIIGVFLVSLFAFTLHYAFMYLGLTTVDSGKTALIKQGGVFIFICISFLFFKEDKFSIFKIIGAILGFASVVVVNFNSLSDFEFGIDKLYLIFTSFCLVAANVSYKKLSGDSNPLIFTSLAMLIGGALLTIVGFSFGGKIPAFNMSSLLVFVYIIVGTMVSYAIWYSLVNQSDLSKLFIIKMLEPLFAVLVSIMIPELHAKIGYEHLISFLLITLAIVISNIKLKAKK